MNFLHFLNSEFAFSVRCLIYFSARLRLHRRSRTRAEWRRAGNGDVIKGRRGEVASSWCVSNPSCPALGFCAPGEAGPAQSARSPSGEEAH